MTSVIFVKFSFLVSVLVLEILFSFSLVLVFIDFFSYIVLDQRAFGILVVANAV